MLKQYIKNYFALSLCLLVGCSSITLQGMNPEKVNSSIIPPTEDSSKSGGRKKEEEIDLISKISSIGNVKQKRLTLNDAIYHPFEVWNRIVKNHDSLFFCLPEGSENAKMNVYGHVMSSLVPLFYAATTFYNLDSINSLLNENCSTAFIKIVECIKNTTPMHVIQKINSLKPIKKAVALFVPYNLVQKCIHYPMQKEQYNTNGELQRYRDGSVVKKIVGYFNPVLSFVSPCYYETTTYWTGKCITFAFLAYAFYSAWHGNRATRNKDVAITLGYFLFGMYASHLAKLAPKEKQKEIACRADLGSIEENFKRVFKSLNIESEALVRVEYKIEEVDNKLIELEKSLARV